MNTESIDCRKVEFGEMEKPGDFTFDAEFKHIYVWLPGASGPDCQQIQRGAPGGSRVWGWDGNEDKPTLTPSILAPGQWHGWLRSGRLVSC
jgi:hypothetical protein